MKASRFAPEKLVKYRKDAGLRQANAAVATDRTEEMVRLWEHGRSYPPIPVLEILARLYGVHPGDFFT